MTIKDDCIAALDAHAAGDWERAHELVQQHEGDADAAWVHAMLHRDEGEDWNADYWYNRAGKPRSNKSVDEEREAIRAAISG